MTKEEMRCEFLVFVHSALYAERAACARVAADEIGGPTGKIIADRIMARRWPPALPPIAIELTKRKRKLRQDGR